ncbi:9439_t:CDS:1, partial [Ambispora gerdemannii]
TQDNAPIHTAGKITENKITIINWPANSPDLNPIENIWKISKDNIKKNEIVPKTVDELKVALKVEWEKIDVAILEQVTASMSRRINTILESNGGPIKY